MDYDDVLPEAMVIVVLVNVKYIGIVPHRLFLPQ